VRLDQGTYSIRLTHNQGHVAARLNAKICVSFEQESEDLIVLAQASCAGLAGPVVLGLCLLELHALREDELKRLVNAKTARAVVRDAHGDAQIVQLRAKMIVCHGFDPDACVVREERAVSRRSVRLETVFCWI
jgi:hypothetical protein